jgi:hypothetical protein
MTAITNEAAGATLDKVRKLLSKAEAEGVTAAEAEALTGKAAELMAKYGIDRALLAATRPETDTPSDRKIDIDNPWARVQAHLLCGIAAAMRCQAVILPYPGSGTRIHLFGYQSDLERTDVMYTSLLLQMWNGFRHARPPEWTSSKKAWNRSWLLGWVSGAMTLVKAAEAAAAREAPSAATSSGSKSMEVVLADRRTVIGAAITRAYPKTRKTSMTYSGSGYGAGYSKGQQADLGGGRVRGGRQSAIGR